jgi:F-type H+-transporting ATPase subunit gamma
MAKGLPILRRRITSIKATKKVTKAMQMIATTKLKTWKQSMIESRLYAGILVDLVQRHLKNEALIQSPFFKFNEGKPSLYIIITSNLGLCGSYNYNVLSYLTKMIQPKDTVFVIGEKGSRYLKNFSFTVDRSFVTAGSLLESDMKPLADTIVEQFLKGTYRDVYVVYSQFVNSLIFRPDRLQLLPLTLPKEVTPLSPNDEPVIEPDPLSVLEKLVPFYLKNTLFSKLIESQVSEQSARRNAMEKASDNADELVEQLQLEFNKQRQANITQEIAEIIGGTAT